MTGKRLKNANLVASAGQTTSLTTNLTKVLDSRLEHFRSELITACSLQCFDSQVDFGCSNGIFLAQMHLGRVHGVIVTGFKGSLKYSPAAKDVLLTSE